MPGKGRPFPKGKSGNPKGKPPLTEDERILKKLTKAQVIELTSLILGGNRKALLEINEEKNQNVSVFQAMLARVAIKIMATGDMDALDKLLNRLIGKVKEEVEVSGEGLRPVLLKFEDNGRQAKPK